MNSIQMDMEKMYGLSIKHLESYSFIFTENKPLNDALTIAKAKHKLISDNSQKQSIVKKGIVTDKRNQIQVAAKSAFKVCNLLVAFAVSQNNQTLKEQADYNFSELTTGRENECIKRFRLILKFAKDNKEALLEYGLTEDKISSFEQKIEDADSSLSLPRQATTASSTATKTIATLYSEMYTLFKDTIDRLVMQYDESHPDFYYEYQKARTIISGSGGRTSKGDNNTPPAQ
ncbi:MAG: hypothetical protein Q8909_02335 [Bacteroidota bacterium]|nr:hypothetical protein [Bacteroidota bacterium]